MFLEIAGTVLTALFLAATYVFHVRPYFDERAVKREMGRA